MQQYSASSVKCDFGPSRAHLLLESELTKLYIESLGLSETVTTVIPEGTSTMEESDVILQYLTDNGISSCIIVSSKFHTRRVRRVFKDKLEDEGIQVLITGAPSRSYEEDKWWQSENGLLAVNNEYVKLLYYWLKY